MHRVALTLRVLASGVLLALAGLALTLTVLAAPPLLAGASFQEPLAYSCHQLPGAPVEERIDVEARWSWWPAGITCTAHEDNGPRVFAAPDWSSATGVYVGTTVILAVEVLCAVGLLALFCRGGRHRTRSRSRGRAGRVSAATGCACRPARRRARATTG